MKHKVQPLQKHKTQKRAKPKPKIVKTLHLNVHMWKQWQSSNNLPCYRPDSH